MYRIIDGRGTGKTSRLMLLAKENNAIIVCSNPKAMEEKARSYGIEGLTFMTYFELLNRRGEGLKRPILIDEIDLLLRSIRPDIIGYSLTNED